MNLTTFLGLKKPARTDPPDITAVNPNWDVLDATLNTLTTGLAGKGGKLTTPTAVRTGAYTASANEVVKCDPAGGAFTVTLPTGAAEGTLVIVRRQAVGGSNAVNVARGGTDTIGGATTAVPIALDGETLGFLKGPAADWTVVFGQKSLSSLDARYAAVGSGGGGGGGYLACREYLLPSSLTITTTKTDIDATNVSVTFVAPASGNVVVTLSLVVDYAGSGTAADAAVLLRDSGGDIAGTERLVGYDSAATGTKSRPTFIKWKRTGLTPGATYTYKFGVYRGSATGSVQVASYASTAYTMFMAVEALPTLQSNGQAA